MSRMPFAAAQVITAVVVAGCSEPAHQAPAKQTSIGQPAPASSSRAAIPKDLRAATAAAQEKVDRHASGDFAGEWLLFTQDLRDHLSQQEFVRYSEKCARTGLKITVAGGRMDGPDHAVVRIELMGVTKSYTMAYEDGAWYQQPAEFLVSNLGKTADQLIAADRAAGGCSGNG